MAHLRHRANPVSHDNDVEIDKAVPVALVVRRDDRMRCERKAGRHVMQPEIIVHVIGNAISIEHRRVIMVSP